MTSLTSEELFLKAYGIGKLNDSRIVRAMISVLGMSKSREIITEYTALEEWDKIQKDRQARVHYSRTSEKMLLSCLLLSSVNFNKYVRELLPCDFFIKQNRVIFDVLHEHREFGHYVDVHVLCKELNQSERMKAAGGIDYVMAVARFAEKDFDADKYFERR